MPEALADDTVAGAGQPSLPPELQEAMIDLLAQAMVAELLETGNPAEPLPSATATGSSPPGHARAAANPHTP